LDIDTPHHTTYCDSKTTNAKPLSAYKTRVASSAARPRCQRHFAPVLLTHSQEWNVCCCCTQGDALPALMPGTPGQNTHSPGVALAQQVASRKKRLVRRPRPWCAACPPTASFMPSTYPTPASYLSLPCGKGAALLRHLPRGIFLLTFAPPFTSPRYYRLTTGVRHGGGRGCIGMSVPLRPRSCARN